MKSFFFLEHVWDLRICSFKERRANKLQTTPHNNTEGRANKVQTTPHNNTKGINLMIILVAKEIWMHPRDCPFNGTTLMWLSIVRAVYVQATLQSFNSKELKTSWGQLLFDSYFDDRFFYFLELGHKEGMKKDEAVLFWLICLLTSSDCKKNHNIFHVLLKCTETTNILYVSCSSCLTFMIRLSQCLTLHHIPLDCALYQTKQGLNVQFSELNYCGCLICIFSAFLMGKQFGLHEFHSSP